MKKLIFPAIFALILAVSAAHGQTISEEIALKGCIHLTTRETNIIRDDASLLSAIRNDGSHERCIREITELGIDLHIKTLVGVSINSGYCRRPAGLAYDLETDYAKSAVTLKVRYDDPRDGLCAALSRYDLWVLIPKPPEGFSIEIDVGANTDSEKSDNPRDL